MAPAGLFLHTTHVCPFCQLREHPLPALKDVVCSLADESRLSSYETHPEEVCRLEQSAWRT